MRIWQVDAAVKPESSRPFRFAAIAYVVRSTIALLSYSYMLLLLRWR